jgi:hypothetical protein
MEVTLAAATDAANTEAEAGDNHCRAHTEMAATMEIAGPVRRRGEEESRRGAAVPLNKAKAAAARVKGQSLVEEAVEVEVDEKNRGAVK